MFTGCGTALVTPFRRDQSLDEETLRKLVRRQIDGGINFLVPCGTTGESPTITLAEHLRVVEIVLEEARGKVPVPSYLEHSYQYSEIGGLDARRDLGLGHPTTRPPRQEGEHHARRDLGLGHPTTRPPPQEGEHHARRDLGLGHPTTRPPPQEGEHHARRDLGLGHPTTRPPPQEGEHHARRDLGLGHYVC